MQKEENMRGMSRRAFLGAGLMTLAGAFLEGRKRRRKNMLGLENYVDAIIEIESHGNPLAERYEPSLDDWSYGLGQLLTKTAKELEKKYEDLPRLGEGEEEIRNSLFDPVINRAYATRRFNEGLSFYDDPFIAVAAYNSGPLTPRNARCQEQLNELYHTSLKTDGVIGPLSREVLKKFQEKYGLEIDGVLGPQSYKTLQCVWMERNPKKENPKGIIPENKYTPNHVKKFTKALGEIRNAL